MTPAGSSVPSILTERLEAPLAPLDRLPHGLWSGSLIHSLGRLVPRLAEVERLRAALLNGGAPDPHAPWPSPSIAAAVAASFRSPELSRLCRGDDAVTDEVLRSLLWHLDRIVDLVDAGASPTEAEALAVDAFAVDWKERCDELDELVEVLGPLGDLPRNTRWNLLRGVLQSAGWQEVVRVRRALERMPELVRLIRRLGRAQETGDRHASQLTPIQVGEPATATRIEHRETDVLDLPGEARGVRRSGHVARMLPSEAVLLAHPRLRLVWHARHAERTLLAYEDDERVPEVLRLAPPVQRESALRAPGPRRELGPMLLCVDTSGSMSGGAEVVAKAVVLEAVRTASAERRACHVFAFGGPGEVVEMSLGVDVDGIERLTRWMGQSFGGGTDIGCALERALARLEEDGWRLADLLIASDGEFGATPAVAAALARAKEERGLRVQGVLVGDRETLGMVELADEIFWMQDWRRFGEASAAAPTLSRTATYFPGAVRTRPVEPLRKDRPT